MCLSPPVSRGVELEVSDMNKHKWKNRLLVAIWNGNTSEIESVFKNVRKPKRLVEARFESMGATCLHFAANAESVRIFLEHGADPNARTYRYCSDRTLAGLTPLICVASAERIAATRSEALRLLIKAGARLNDASEFGLTALHDAIDVAATQVLLAAGADLEALDVYRQTPLHVVKLAEQTRVLLAAGANVRAKDDLGREPLYYAKSIEQALCLLEAGAAIDGATMKSNAFVVEAYSIRQNKQRLEHAEVPAAAKPRRRA